MEAQTLAILTGLSVLFAFVFVVLWIILPFAIFGVKPLLKDILNETKDTNLMLRDLRTGLGGLGKLQNETVDAVKSLQLPKQDG